MLKKVLKMYKEMAKLPTFHGISQKLPISSNTVCFAVRVVYVLQPNVKIRMSYDEKHLTKLFHGENGCGVMIFRPRRSTTYVDAAYRYRGSSVVCLCMSVCHDS